MPSTHTMGEGVGIESRNGVGEELRGHSGFLLSDVSLTITRIQNVPILLLMNVPLGTGALLPAPVPSGSSNSWKSRLRSVVRITLPTLVRTSGRS